MTILGKHTVAETRDLITTIQGRVTDLYNTIMGFNPAQQTVDPTLLIDWNAWLNKWIQEVASETQHLDQQSAYQPLVPESAIADEPAFTRVLTTVNSKYPGPYTTQDLPGLQIRIQKIGPIKWVDRPQPSSFDLDFGAYTVADKPIAALKCAEASVVQAAKDNWKPLLIGGAGLLGGAVLLRKIGLL